MTKKTVTMKPYFLLSAVLTIASVTIADDRGAPIFGDSFDTSATFAENWVSRRCQSDGGVVKVPNGAEMHWRGDTPLEFVAEADVSVRDAVNLPKGAQRGWGGFSIDSYHFSMQPNGTTFCVWKLPEAEHSSGKYVRVPGVREGDAVRLRLVRKQVPGGVKYVFSVNGIGSGEFVTPEPKLSPLKIYTYNVDMTVDNFVLSSVRHDDDSPNMIYNSGFEHDEDGLPTYYCLFGGFPWGTRPIEEYEDVYLKRWMVDRNEKHSGQQSLMATLSPSISRDVSFSPWQVGVVAGQPGVFSLWAKTDVSNGVDIAIAYGKGRAVCHVDSEWRRFEACCTNLPAKSVYSHANVRIINASQYIGHVWFDDLQAEIVPMPEGGKFDPSKTYATDYLPSELDRSRFGERKAPELPAPVKVAKLPHGVKPTDELDGWTNDAVSVGPFWVCQAKPRRETQAWAACDDDNLYLGFRNFGETAGLVTHERGVTDNPGPIFMRDSLEIFLQPVADGDYYHFFAASNGDQADLYANNLKWNGSWKVAARANETAGSVDYLITVPFSDFVTNGITGKWHCNLGRNDRPAEETSKGILGECQSTAKTVKLSFSQTEFWGEYELPADVAAKWTRKAAELKTSAKDGKKRILGRLDFYMNEPEARFRIWDTNGEMSEHSVDIHDMPYGTNKVTVAGLDTEVVKLPYIKGAVQVNHFSRSIIHDGKPVLFTGIFIGDNGFSQGLNVDKKKWDAILDLFEKYGFKYSHILTGPKKICIKSTQYLIDEGAKRGIPFILWGKFSDKDFLVNKRGVPAESVMDEKEMVEAFPLGNILSYIVMDEPELGMPSGEARAYLEHMKEYFPYAPCQMNNTVIGIPSRYADLKTDILMLDDYLTNNENRTVDSVVSQVDYMMAADPGKPCWYFIVGDNISLHYRFPTYREQVAQSWGCICAGATGISWYIGIPGAYGSWRAMVDVNREVQSLVPVLLSEEVVPQATATEGKKKLRHLTKKLGDSWYVFSCNVDASPLDNVTFALPEGAPKNGTVEVLFENRTLQLADGIFTDSYPAHERHIYRIGR